MRPSFRGHVFHLAVARWNMGLRGSTALPRFGRSDLPVRRNLPQTSAAMSAGRALTQWQ
jgi:hypothetical protein